MQGWLSSLLVGLIFGILSSTLPASGQTTWHYFPTNAFPNVLFTNPTCIASPPGETNRLFILEKHGRIVVITNLAAPTRTIFMDISSRVHVTTAGESADVSGEEGLLGLAFHPGYATNRYFYVFYTAPDGSVRDDVLSRFQTTNANAGDPNSETRFIAQVDEANNHNAGDLHFGPDGYLYVSLGDEGGANDQYFNSQRIDKDFFSAIMRLDVDQQPGNLAPNPHASIVTPAHYSVPSDNPFVGATQFNGVTVNPANVRTEFWAVGMRNPWRYSFDPLNGDLMLGHVGQDSNEWVNLVTKGTNCGWNLFEGDRQRSNSLPAGFTFTHPLVQYGHTNGRVCIIGGITYRGNRWPDLVGAYLYADYGSGEVWALRHTGNVVSQNTILFTNSPAHAACFGADPSNGDPLYAAIRSGIDSVIYRIVSTNTVPAFNTIGLVGTNVVVSGTNGPRGGTYYLSSSPGIGLAPSSWTRLSTNSFDADGNFNFTNPVNTGTSSVFYLLQLP